MLLFLISKVWLTTVAITKFIVEIALFGTKGPTDERGDFFSKDEDGIKSQCSTDSGVREFRKQGKPILPQEILDG